MVQVGNAEPAERGAEEAGPGIFRAWLGQDIEKKG